MKQDELRQQKRRQILEATCRCLRQKPFHALTIKDIAAEAGLSHGLVHYYFANKQEVLLETIAFLSEYFRTIAAEEIAALGNRTLEADDLLHFFRRFHERIYVGEYSFYSAIWLDICTQERFDEAARTLLENDPPLIPFDSPLIQNLHSSIEKKDIFDFFSTYFEGTGIMITLYHKDPQEIIDSGERILRRLIAQ